MSRVPGLVIRFGFTFLRFKRKVRKCAKVLRKSLVKNGMDKKLAKELAEAYEINLSIRELIKGRGVDIPFFNF